MAIVLLLALFGVSLQAEPGQTRGQAVPVVQAPDRVAEAYQQFLLGHRLEDENNAEGAAAAYRRAMELDPEAADIPASLAILFARQNRAAEAIDVAQRALKIAPDNRDAHRVLGTIYAANASVEPRGTGAREAQQQNLRLAIQHLEEAVARPVGEQDADVNARVTLARMYLMAGTLDKAIPLLEDLVKQEPEWQDASALLVQAYEAAGRSDDAIRWLEGAVVDNPQLYPTLGDYYGRKSRWNDAAAAYEQALKLSPPSFGLRVRYASMLLNVGGKEEAVKARDTLREAVGTRGTDERALYLLSQAERRSGDLAAAETTARRLIGQNATNPRGHSALAEALSEQRRYGDLANALAPAVARFRSGADPSFALALLLPHLGFAYLQVGRYDEAIGAFEEVRKISPRDVSLTAYLIEAHLAAKHFDQAIEIARGARAEHPEDVSLAGFEAEALQRSGKSDQAIAVLGDLLERRGDDPQVHIALAHAYSEANRGAQAVKVLQDAQSRFPSETTVTFRLGSTFEQQKKYAEAEAAFRQVIAQDPDHAQALNYLGYMLAERGQRLDESVALIKRALAIEPDNGSYLDSLGWAYYRDGQFELAEENLRRAAEQLSTNSVVQDHYGEVLLKLGRLQQAIDRWTQALSGDRDSIDVADIERKIRSAREKLPKR